jgi:hypothetical protein
MRITRVMSLAAVIPVCRAAAEVSESTRLLLRVINRVSTRTAKTGDAVYMQTVTPVSAEGRVVIPVDSYVIATITELQRSKRVRGRARLSLRIHSFMLPSSGRLVAASLKVVSIDSNGGEQHVIGMQGVAKQGPDPDRRVARGVQSGFTGLFHGVIAGGILGQSGGALKAGAIAGASLGIGMAVLARGPEVELIPGTTIDAAFDQPVTIE